MNTKLKLSLSVLALTGLVTMGSANAQQPIKIGIVAHLSGPYAATGQKFQQGIEAFFSIYGRKAGGRDVQLIFRDMAGADPSKAKQLTEELIVKDEVKLIGGYFLSPELLASGPALTQGKVPGVVFNGSALAITQSSPYLIRAAGSMHQVVKVQADFVYAQGKRKAYIAVSDYSVGYDVLDLFKKRFTALGGTIVGEDKMPLNTVDYSPFAERIAAAKPDVIELFVPNGAPSIAMTKALRGSGLLLRPDIMAMGQGWIDDPSLAQYDDSVVGAYDAQVYALRGTTPENGKFKDAMKAKFPDVIPSYEAASAFDGMHILYKLIESQAGKTFDGLAAVRAAQGWTFEGARGPQTIEPESRGTAMNVYIRRVVKEDGQLRLMVAHTAEKVPVVP